MIAIAFLFVRTLCDCFKSRWRLEAEILVLRHQLNVLRQRAPRRLHLRWADRALFIWLYRRCPRILDAITIVRPETVVRWHRIGFAAYWRWKSRPLGGRPQIGKEVRYLIRRMSFENPLWGAPKIHGELLKLGIEVAQSTVSIYMVPRQDRPLQTWKTFLCNHVEGIASIDFIVVPTIAFQQLFAFLVLGHGRRRLLWIAVTRNPTAEWLARQITEAFPWERAPKYLIRDNDRAFGVAFKARIRAMGIRDQPISFRSPWQNGYVERLIGSIRRECTDHLLVFNAEHLRRILSKYASYYNEARTHVSLGKDAPCRRPIEQFGDIVAYPPRAAQLHLPNAAAQTRMVSMAGIRLRSWESARAFKGIICDDISQFESHMPSHAVGSLWGDGDPKGSPQSGGRRKTGVPNKVNSARVERALAHFTKQLRAPDCACATTAWLRRMAPKAHQGLR